LTSGRTRKISRLEFRRPILLAVKAAFKARSHERYTSQHPYCLLSRDRKSLANRRDEPGGRTRGEPFHVLERRASKLAFADRSFALAVDSFTINSITADASLGCGVPTRAKGIPLARRNSTISSDDVVCQAPSLPASGSPSCPAQAKAWLQASAGRHAFNRSGFRGSLGLLRSAGPTARLDSGRFPFTHPTATGSFS
jgi:hypothetical protein